MELSLRPSVIAVSDRGDETGVWFRNIILHNHITSIKQNSKRINKQTSQKLK